MKPEYITPTTRGTFSDRMKRLDLKIKRLHWYLCAFGPILVLGAVWAIWQIAKAL